MRPISAFDLLNIWERSSNHSLPEKGLLLLDTVGSDGDPEDPGLLSIGDRDFRLLQLREWIFGTELQNVSNCPQCAERIEWITDINDLRVSTQARIGPSHLFLEADSYNIQFRLPNSYDLSRHSYGDPKKLLTDCVIEVQKNASNCPADELPDEVFSKLDERMAEEDPQADIRMRLSCPACTHTWETQFDIVSYLWMEIDSWAKHILQEIALLATAFGWSESQILGLSPRRRQLYLEIIRR